jgi:hypothetical protein
MGMAGDRASRALDSAIKKLIKKRKGRMDPEQFARYLKRNFPVDAAHILNMIQRKTALDIFTGTLKRWPVDTGWSRANWQVSVGSPVEDKKPSPNLEGHGRPIPLDGGDTANALNGMKMSPVEIGRTIFISNPLPYAGVIEYGLYPPGPKTSGGYSKQAPKGAVRLAIQSVLGKGAIKDAK